MTQPRRRSARANALLLGITALVSLVMPPAVAAGAAADARATSGPASIDPALRRAVEAARRGAPLPPIAPADRAARDPGLRVKAGLVDGASWSRLRPALQDLGIELRGRVGSIAALRVPASAFDQLAALPGVRWIRAARTYHLTNDVSTGAAYDASDAANSTFGTKGAGVIVAIIDTGINWRDNDFRNPDGTTRMLGIWDQTIVDPLHGPPAGFSFGAFYSRADINAGIAGIQTILTGDGHGHGSHVAGTAAGNGRTTGLGIAAGTFAGVAPEADLLVVRVFDDQGSYCLDCDLTAAMQFIRQTAAAAGKPWVANMSLGTDLGSHDGTDPDELTIDQFAGPGRSGAQVAVAAGNSNTRAMHWSGSIATPGTVLTTQFNPTHNTLSGAENEFLWMDLWYDGGDSATVEIVTPGGTVVSAALGADSGIRCTADGAVQIDATNVLDPLNGANEVFIQLWDSSACSPVVGPRAGTWTLRVRAVSAGSAGPHVFDVWNEADLNGVAFVTFSPATAGLTAGIPGTTRYGLTAGSYVSKCQWVNSGGTVSSGCATSTVGGIVASSGAGPTRDGRIKPDVAAPGQFIGSTYTGLIRSTGNPLQLERDGQHGNISGTSMATPHLTGTAALLLALKPGLLGTDIKAAMQASARADSFTGTVPNNRFGAGKLRTLEAAYQAASLVIDLAATSSGGFTGADNPLMDGYDVYRGTIPGIAPGNDGSCFLTGVPSPSFSDPQSPAAGQAFFYLVAGANRGLGIRGILGTDSAGRLRVPAVPCP